MEYIIYKIYIVNKPDFLYVGSTKKFNHRKYSHINSSKDIKTNSLLLYTTINENGGWTNCEMTPLEKITCSSKIDARIREEYWRQQLNANLNMVRCYVSKNEQSEINKNHYKQNKDSILVNHREYYHLNKDKLNEKSKIWRETNRETNLGKKKEYYERNKDTILVAQKEYRKENDDKIKEYKTNWYENNKEKRHEQNKETVDCCCGKKFTLCNKSRHDKTIFHIHNATDV
jgi:hypothetical protein